ncbi:hypothetical protein [Streptomyces sp. NPDC006335]|uniref:hypothetical protein n=1 Tax=Streptomyces sp. NPDC006335 TaxID=3156895 RepID=UPI0033A5BB6F
MREHADSRRRPPAELAAERLLDPTAGLVQPDDLDGLAPLGVLVSMASRAAAEEAAWV